MPRRDGIYKSQVMQTPRNRAVVAAARNYSVDQASRKISESRVFQESREWQRILWKMYDCVPEYRFAVTWVGNILSKAKLLVHENGEPTKNSHAADALASLFGGPDGHPEMLRMLGINFTVAGEGWIIGEQKSRDEDEWDVIAATEIEVQGAGGDRTIKVDGEEASENALCLRMWKPHPQKTSAPDAPSRAVIPILNEIVKLTEHVDAQTSSRLASAGILFVPEEMEIPGVPVTTASDDPDNPDTSQQDMDAADSLTQRLIDIASIAIKDRSSAAAMVPLVITAPGEFLEHVQHMTFWSGLDEHAKGLREEAIRRLANGMDMPPEVLLGTADVNHWSAWQIEEASIKSHTEPLLTVILSSLTTGYLRPYLEENGVENAEEFTLEADTSEMRLRPNRSKEAMELYDRGEINGATVRRENGFNENDAPSAEELTFWLKKNLAKGQTMPADVRAALRMLGVDLPEVATEGDVEVVHEARPTRSLKEHPRRSEPDPEKSEAIGAKAASLIAAAPPQAAAPDGLVLATDQMVRRALERAGNRLKNRLNGRVPGKARDLYLSMPSISDSEAEKLLEDAWDLDDFEYPGVDCDRLRGTLHQYTSILLRMQKPHDRSALARHLLMSMSDAA